MVFSDLRLICSLSKEDKTKTKPKSAKLTAEDFEFLCWENMVGQVIYQSKRKSDCIPMTNLYKH